MKQESVTNAALHGLHSLALRPILNETIHLRIASNGVSRLKQRKVRGKPEALHRAECPRQRSHFTEKIRLRVSPSDTCFQVAIAPYRFVNINDAARAILLAPIGRAA